MENLSRATAAGLVMACHDLSEGGLAVALAEMAIGGNLGADIDLALVPATEDCRQDDRLLFSESNSRFLVEVHPDCRDDFEQIMAESACAAIGRVNHVGSVNITGLFGREVISLEVGELKKAWQERMGW